MLFAARVLTALYHKYQPSLTGADTHTIIRKNTALLGTSPCWQVSVKDARSYLQIHFGGIPRTVPAAKAFKLEVTKIFPEHRVVSDS